MIAMALIGYWFAFVCALLVLSALTWLAIRLWVRVVWRRWRDEVGINRIVREILARDRAQNSQVRS